MILVADIGGTNTRIGLGDGAGGLHRLRVLKNTDIADLREPLAETVADGGDIRAGVIALAAPVDADEVRLTNYPRKLSRPELQRSLGLQRLLFVNDFVAAAYAVPALAASDLFPIQTGDAVTGGNILVCGPGTGFGAAVRIQSKERSVSLSTEAGHMILGASNDEEARLFARLAPAGRPLGVEAVVSGGGLRALYRAISGTQLSSTDIIASVRAQEKDAGTAIAAFMRVFGRISGDLVLAYNALGGIYIAGGLGRALETLYRGSPFLEAFNGHPPYEERMRRVPVRVITHEQPVLLGAVQIGLAA